ncbi:Pr6Pr family membrane protein [Leucobacter chromiiresistens]
MAAIPRAFAITAALAALLIAAAVVGQWAFSLSFEPDDLGFFTVNFFSFFTILSNVAAAAALAIGAWVTARGAGAPGWFWGVFGAVTTYMATTGVVYNTLLRGISLDQEATLGWSNEVLHLIGPILVVALWCVAPGRPALPWRHLALAAAFPLAWGAYTLLRGALVDWYPYPFTNPAQPGGYGAVALYLVAIAACIIGVDAAIVRVSRGRRAAGA